MIGDAIHDGPGAGDPHDECNQVLDNLEKLAIPFVESDTRLELDLQHKRPLVLRQGEG
jgi:hypothetical protein